MGTQFGERTVGLSDFSQPKFHNSRSVFSSWWQLLPTIPDTALDAHSNSASPHQRAQKHQIPPRAPGKSFQSFHPVGQHSLRGWEQVLLCKSHLYELPSQCWDLGLGLGFLKGARSPSAAGKPAKHFLPLAAPKACFCCTQTTSLCRVPNFTPPKSSFPHIRPGLPLPWLDFPFHVG